MVKGIINLVKQFGVITVAEGIESMDQVEFLRSVHCDMIQGYVYYPPSPHQDSDSQQNSQTE